MTFISNSVEMAPGIEWGMYSVGEGMALLPADSGLLDDVAGLNDVLAGTIEVADLLGTKIGDGGEGVIYRISGQDRDYVVKVPHYQEGIEIDYFARTMQFARYGGVSVERALGGVELDGVPIRTPHYEAVLSTDNFDGVVMTYESGSMLRRSDYAKQLDEFDYIQLWRRLKQRIEMPIIESGALDRSGGHLDLHSGNFLVRQDSAGGLTEWIILDAIDTGRHSDEPIEDSPRHGIIK